MKTLRRLFVLLVVLCLALSACAAGARQVAPAATLPPEHTAEPTPTLEPTLQPTPTQEPTPEPTLRLTPTPRIMPIEALNITGTPIEIDVATYHLIVDGLVEHPLSLSYEELLALPTVSQVPRLECPGFFIDYAEWTGPLVRTILEMAGVKPQAVEVEFSEADEYPYQRTLALDEALADDTYLAHSVNGETLPVAHGFPLRLVTGSKLGDYWVKWLGHVEVK